METEELLNDQLDEVETLTIEQVDYKKLDKVDLIRLCEEKDAAITSYETERTNIQNTYNKRIEDMTEFYAAKIKGLNYIIKYYERKFKLVKDIINIDKEEIENDTIQRTTKGQA